MSRVYEIFTDGAYDYSSQIGSYAFCVFANNTLIYTESGLVENATCNRAEFEAVIRAFEYAKSKLQDGRLIIGSDSSLLVNTFNSWGERWVYGNKLHKRKNTDLVLRLLKLKEELGCRVRLVWVKGHAGILGNEISDRLAKEVIEKEKLLRATFDHSPKTEPSLNQEIQPMLF